MEATRYFTIERKRNHWFLLNPEGEPFFTIGLNHLDSTPLHNPAFDWKKAFGNSQRKWLHEQVGPDLRRWGFNTVGWVQEVVVRGDMKTSSLHRHSRNFIYEEYQWIDLPYCHMLHFSEPHQWDIEHPFPKVQSTEFEEWCEYVAKNECSRFADDPKLIGYFYSDCPNWAHQGYHGKAPWFDTEMLKSDKGKQELRSTARRYYSLLHEAVRRHDKNHLIFGDRYEANAFLPEEVVSEAVPYIDVFSLQCFGSLEIKREAIAYWGSTTGLPVLLADAPREQPFDSGSEGNYLREMRALRVLKACIGWHYCGAYVRNDVRQRGLRDSSNREDRALLEVMKTAHSETADYVHQQWAGLAPAPKG